MSYRGQQFFNKWGAAIKTDKPIDRTELLSDLYACEQDLSNSEREAYRKEYDAKEREAYMKGKLEMVTQSRDNRSIAVTFLMILNGLLIGLSLYLGLKQ